MTVARSLYVFALMMVVGVATVAIRAESAKVANRIQKLHRTQMNYEQTLWTQELELARLRAPDEIRRRALELGLTLMPPPIDPGVRSDNARTGD